MSTGNAEVLDQKRGAKLETVGSAPKVRQNTWGVEKADQERKGTSTPTGGLSRKTRAGEKTALKENSCPGQAQE